MLRPLASTAPESSSPSSIPESILPIPYCRASCCRAMTLFMTCPALRASGSTSQPRIRRLSRSPRRFPATKNTVAMVSQSTAAILDQSTAAILDYNNLPHAFGHCTMVAGIVHLVAPSAQILPLKAFSGDGTANLSNILRAVYFAADKCRPGHQHELYADRAFGRTRESNSICCKQGRDLRGGGGEYGSAWPGKSGKPFSCAGCQRLHRIWMCAACFRAMARGFSWPHPARVWLLPIQAHELCGGHGNVVQFSSRRRCWSLVTAVCATSRR